jgi:hypothetical protein
LKKLEGIEAVSHVAPYVDKLAQSRKKLSKVDMLVQNTQERVENIQRMHAQLLAFEKSQKVPVTITLNPTLDHNPHPQSQRIYRALCTNPAAIVL